MTILSFPFLTCYSIFVLPIPKYYNYTMSDHFVPVVPQRRLRLPLCGCGCWPASPVVGCSVGAAVTGVSSPSTGGDITPTYSSLPLCLRWFLLLAASTVCLLSFLRCNCQHLSYLRDQVHRISASAISGFRCTGSAAQSSRRSEADILSPSPVEVLEHTNRVVGDSLPMCQLIKMIL